MSKMIKIRYHRPELARMGNLKDVTADWQCSLGSGHDEREREREREHRGNGHH